MPLTEQGYLIREEDQQILESYKLSPEELNAVTQNMQEFLRGWGVNQDADPVYFSHGALPQWLNAHGVQYFPHFSQEIDGQRGVLYAATNNVSECDRRILNGFGNQLVALLLDIANE